MKRDVMLPKFNLPGQTTWLMKGVWIAGAVVLVQVAVVTTLLLRHRVGPSETATTAAPATEVPAAAINAKTTASAPEPAAAAAPEGAGRPETEPAAPRGAAGRQGPPADGPRMKRGFASKPGLARMRGKGRRNGERVFARTSLPARKAAAAGRARKAGLRNDPRNPGPRPAGRAGKPDAIDQLLRNFN